MTKDSTGPADMTTPVPLTPEQLARIRAELNEEESSRERDIGHIRAWLAQQPHLPRIDDDNFILAFLRGCKFSLEKTKRKLDMYFTMRGAAPELFAGRDVDGGTMPELLKRVWFGLSPRLTPAGHRVALQVVRPGRERAGATPQVLDVVRMLLSLVELQLCEQRQPAAGLLLVLDATLYSPAYLAQFTPTLARRIITCMQLVGSRRTVQEALPLRVHQIHLINMQPLAETVLNATKPLFKPKLRQRIFAYGSKLEGLTEHVPRDCLPAELDGTLGPMQDLSDAWMDKIRRSKDWFRQQEQVKADESLRPGKPRNYDEMFGVEGSFRKLDID